jgi:beta-mannanase
MLRHLASSLHTGALALLLLASAAQPAFAQVPTLFNQPAQDPAPAPLIAPAAVEQQDATTSIYWGAWIDGSQYGHQNAPWDTGAIDHFEANAGKRISILHWGQAWQRCGTTCVYQEFNEQKPQYDAMWQRGIIPLIDWASWNSSASPKYTQPAFSLGRIIAGDHDAYIHRWAQEAKAWGHPFFLRFNWEMNGNWFPWSETRNGNSSGQYVTAWRHVRDIFRAEGVINVSWVWCPNVVNSNSTVSLSHYYPGRKYVDWMCIDGYNWGANPIQPDRWKSFSELFNLTYTQLIQIGSKPIMIGETASSELGGSKAAWITDMLTVALPQKFPRIGALVWFNWNAGGLDWVIETSPSAQAAFANGIASPYYRTGQLSAASTTDDLLPNRRLFACPDDECLYLPAVSTE